MTDLSICTTEWKGHFEMSWSNTGGWLPLCGVPLPHEPYLSLRSDELTLFPGDLDRRMTWFVTTNLNTFYNLFCRSIHLLFPLFCPQTLLISKLTWQILDSWFSSSSYSTWWRSRWVSLHTKSPNLKKTHRVWIFTKTIVRLRATLTGLFASMPSLKHPSRINSVLFYLPLFLFWMQISETEEAFHLFLFGRSVWRNLFDWPPFLWRSHYYIDLGD